MFLRPDCVTSRIIGLTAQRYLLHKRQFFLAHHLLDLCLRIGVATCCHLHLLALQSYPPLHYIISFHLLAGFISLETNLISRFIILVHCFHPQAITASHHLRENFNLIPYQSIFNQYFKFGSCNIDHHHYFNSYHSFY